MRIAVLTDVHANLPALEAALTRIRQDGYDLLIHIGDLIGIGPFPAECLERLLSTPRTCCLMGNHDAWFAYGLPTPQPSWMSDGEVEHQHWTHSQISKDLREVVSTWPDVLVDTYDDVSMTFLHYPLVAPRVFRPIVRQPVAAELDAAFAAYRTPLIFYGHHHPFSDVIGRARYVNPGSLGCAATAEAHYSMVVTATGRWSMMHHRAPYEDAPLITAFEQRAVPERAFIYRAFFGGRFGA